MELEVAVPSDDWRNPGFVELMGDWPIYPLSVFNSYVFEQSTLRPINIK
jgi:hypothetical protein